MQTSYLESTYTSVCIHGHMYCTNMHVYAITYEHACACGLFKL